MRAKRLIRLLDPPFLAADARRLVTKARRRARRVERRVVTLSPSGPRPPRGAVLFSFILDPFLLAPDAAIPYEHTHDWESLRMACTFVELGYEVDAIHWTNASFVPDRHYAALVDVRLNMERLAPLVGPKCLKILHAETAHPGVHNPAQRRRLEDLAARRGVRLPPSRLIEENRAIEHADCATVLGNEFTAASYAFAGKPLYRVPISAPFLYPPPTKDFGKARRGFLWFGSGGLVHKGLDRVLEAFAGMPDLSLTVCGPIAREPAFEEAYWRELYATPGIRTLGWVDVGSQAFLELARECLAAVYPSCSEGGGGSVVTCMHAGLIPLVTREASVDLPEGGGMLLADASVDGIRAAVRRLAARPASELEAMARRSWAWARERHTRERFASEYRRVIETILLAGGVAAAGSPAP